MKENRKKAIAVAHVDFEGLGTLQALLEKRGFDIERVEAPTADWETLMPASADLVIVLGGPLGVADEPVYPFLLKEQRFIQHCLAAHVPLIGICLGAQLIAAVLGARVAPMDVKEIGFAPLELTAAGRESVLAPLADTPVLHWHGDQFDIPAGASNLAKTAIGQHQAFALGTQVLALQFHLEFDACTIERWLVGNACELAYAGVDPHVLRADTQRYGQKLAAAAHDVFGKWLAAAGL